MKPPNVSHPPDVVGQPLPMALQKAPIDVGRMVAIIRLGAQTPPYLEGFAKIEAPAAAPHHYHVRFEGDVVNRERVVLPIFQQNPKAIVEALGILWAAEPSLLAAFSDFFPEE